MIGALVLAVKIVVGAWLGVSALLFVFMRGDRKTNNHSFQATSKTWRWRAKLALLWPYWMSGLTLLWARGVMARRSVSK